MFDLTQSRSAVSADRALAALVDQATAIARRLEAVDLLVRAGRLDAVGNLLADERERMTRMIRLVRRRGY